MINGRSIYSFLMVALVSVANADDYPVGISDKSSTSQNQPTAIAVLSNDTGHNLAISSVNESSVRWGRISINQDKTTLTYTPYQDFVGNDSFWYVLKDDQGRTNAAQVFVTVGSDGPTAAWPLANTDTIDADYGAVVKIPVLSNDEGVGLKLVDVNAWSVNQGKAWITSNSEIAYEQYGSPRGDQQDEFWYVFEDQWGRRNAAKVVVSLTENSSSAWPTATPDFATASNGLRIGIQVLNNDIGSDLTIEEANEWTKNGGKTRIFGANVRYTPPTNFTGTDSFWYQFADDQGRTNSAKVDVEVTANTQKSVVEFCGNTYETDGTLGNTQLSNLSPAQSVSYPSTALTQSGVIGDPWIVDGRRYYVEGSVGSEQTVWMEIDGVRTWVSAVQSDLPTHALGVYKGVFYYTQNGRYLYAHTGSRLIEHGDLLKDIVQGDSVRVISDTSQYETTIERVEGQGDAIYFSVYSKYIGLDLPNSFTTWWRISGDLDWSPVQVQLTSSFSGPSSSTASEVSNFYYFNGMDYFSYYSRGSFPNSATREYSAKLVDTGLEVDSAIGDVEKIIEDRGRLFVLTKWVPDGGRSEFPAIPSKLYVVDNATTNSFVELVACDQ